ncbi:MAG: rRNA maturation RNase YbeY [Betaproteobacteria bacterium]
MSGTPKRKPGRTPELALTVQYGTRCAQLPPPAKLRLWARAALRKNARVTLRLIGEREARELNRNFRGRDYATNVLTFIYSKKSPLEGDIAICAPVVAREAGRPGAKREAHYAHLTVHGMLHLQGYDHARAPAARRMENLETRILARLGYADPYCVAALPAARKPATSAARPLPRKSAAP